MNKLVALCALAASACISDMSVGFSRSEVIVDDDGGSPVQEADAGVPVLDAGSDAQVVLDASPIDAGADASEDAAVDAGPGYFACEYSECLISFIAPVPPSERCDNGDKRVCGRPERERACEWLCIKD